jgi:hypothetical protein
MANETENQTSFKTDAVMEVLQRTEAERVRMEAVAAHERGMVGDLDETENQTMTREEGAQIRHENALMKNEMAVMMTNMRALTTAQETERELSTAQGAGGMGPAHGQAPPKAAQGVQRSQSSQVLSFTRTMFMADLFGSMADETAELSYLVGSMAGETSSDWVGSMADETENQVPNIPNLTEAVHEAEVRGNPAWKVGGPAWSGWGQAQICLAAWPTKLRTRALISPTTPRGAVGGKLRYVWQHGRQN